MKAFRSMFRTGLSVHTQVGSGINMQNNTLSFPSSFLQMSEDPICAHPRGLTAPNPHPVSA